MKLISNMAFSLYSDKFQTSVVVKANEKFEVVDELGKYIVAKKWAKEVVEKKKETPVVEDKAE